MSLVEIPLTTHKIFKSQIETGDYQDITTTEKKRKEQVLPKFMHVLETCLYSVKSL